MVCTVALKGHHYITLGVHLRTIELNMGCVELLGLGGLGALRILPSFKAQGLFLSSLVLFTYIYIYILYVHTYIPTYICMYTYIHIRIYI